MLTQIAYLILLCKLQGVGGAVELAPGYLKLVYDIVRKAGGVCIADEVQTGFGRTGSHYWGFETQGVIPDIVTMAKVYMIIPLPSLVYHNTNQQFSPVAQLSSIINFDWT